MDGDDRDLRRAVQQLANDTLQDTLANVRHHSEVRRLVARGDLSDQELAAAYADYAQHNGPEYRRSVADLSVRYYAALAELANDYSRRFYEQVVAGLVPLPTDDRLEWSMRRKPPGGEQAAGSPPPTPPAARVPMELHAAPGHVATGSFSLDNRRDEAVTVSFEVSSWRGSDGRVFDNPVVVVPEWVQLPANGRADVTVSVRLRPELYASDHLYTATLAVRGHDGLTLLLNAWVELAADEASRRLPTDEAPLVHATTQAAAPEVEPAPGGLPVTAPTRFSGARATTSEAAKPGATSSARAPKKRPKPTNPAGRRSSGPGGGS